VLVAKLVDGAALMVAAVVVLRKEARSAQAPGMARTDSTYEGLASVLAVVALLRLGTLPTLAMRASLRAGEVEAAIVPVPSALH